MSEKSTIPPLPDYPERIVTFIDLLGFTRDVQMIEQRPGLLLSIHAVLSPIANCKRDLDRERASGNIRFDARLTHASDSLMLSYSLEAGACSRAISHAAFLGNVCVRRGYLPRGVITIGKLIHDDAVLFGGGLIEAYNIERNDVVEPRIAIMPRVMEIVRSDFARTGQMGAWKPFLRNRGSGDFVHILGPEWPFLKKMAADGDDGVPDMFAELREMLPLRYKNVTDDRQRSKIEWMAEYVNDSITEHGLPKEWKVSLKTD
jgi:hypothetical protein